VLQLVEIIMSLKAQLGSQYLLLNVQLEENLNIIAFQIVNGKRTGTPINEESACMRINHENDKRMSYELPSIFTETLEKHMTKNLLCVPLRSTEYPLDVFDEIPVRSVKSPLYVLDEIPLGSTECPVNIIDKIPVRSTESPFDILDKIPMRFTEYPHEILDEISLRSTECPLETPNGFTECPNEIPDGFTEYPNEIPAGSTEYPDEIPLRLVIVQLLRESIRNHSFGVKTNRGPRSKPYPLLCVCGLSAAITMFCNRAEKTLACYCDVERFVDRSEICVHANATGHRYKQS
jgi:hypothetical protein